MKNLSPKIILLGVVGFLVVIFLLMLVGILPGIKKKTTGPVLKGSLIVWTLSEKKEQAENLQESIKLFKQTYPGVTIQQRNFTSLETYENTLLDALSAGEGPDIFMIENKAVPRYANKLLPLTPEIFSISALQNNFPRVVEQDFAPQGKIYGLPLSLDTLVMIYNRNLLDQAAVLVPNTWEDFQESIPKITQIENGNIIHAGAALGGSQKNIHVAPDLLSLLFLQTGIKMVNPGFTSATFSSKEGNNVLNFYTNFANPNSPTFTWDNSLPDSRDAFAEERVSIIFDYASAIPEIKKRNKFISLGVAEIPSPREQRDRNKRMTYASYLGYVVSRQTKAPEAAMHFISFITTNEASAKIYFETTQELPALRSLLASLQTNPDFSVFAKQVLIATSWPQADNRIVDTTFSTLIEKVSQNGFVSGSFLEEAQDTISKSMQKQNQ